MLRTRRRRSPFALLSSLMFVGLAAGPVAAEPIAPAADPRPAAAALTSGQVRLTHVVSGLSSPLGVVNAGDGSSRLFVLEKRGTVRVVSGGALQSGYFLDIRGIGGGLTTDGERGLLGLAFHPSFESNRKLFIYYTRGDGDIVIAELTANASRTSVSLDTRRTLLVIEHGARNNHNGGQLLFGADGYLYALTGDGGGSGDPDDNAQDTTSLLGKTLRIAPNLNGGYSSPGGNPNFGAAARDELWSIGLRNPWKASFDRANGNLWIADVGQGSWEEVNREPAGVGGRNYGWPCREGKHAYRSCGASGPFTDPVAEYARNSGNCSVTGGYVYRGGVFRDLIGHYVLGDFCSGNIWTLPAGAASPTLRFHRDTSAMITSFGEAENGELYLTDYAGGALYRVVAPPFSDVTDSKFLNDIMWLFYQDITRGCGADRFCPKGSVTRDQMASFLDRVLNLPATSTDYFDDDDGNKHEGAINRVAKAGITVGCAANRYCPSGVVTRAQMATFLDRAIGFPVTSRDFFTDDNSNKHENSINRMAAAGVTRGCTATTFCPNGSTVREQMAAFLHRAFD